jgi:CPA2 family monovalent cation:H+ antiporter-2
MPHDTPLITTIVAALVLAFIFGAIANRLKMPPLVGYLIAGVAVGPHSPGFVADQTLAPQLAEIGVILLMFGVGLEFSLRDLLSVRAVAIPGALIRLALATALGVGLSTMMGWPLLGGVVFGLALAVSSTVVTLKALQDRHLVDSDRGHIAMGWLVVEDLAMVLALVLIPALAAAGVGGGGIAGVAAQATHAAEQDAFVNLTEHLLNVHLNLWAIIGLTLLKLLAFVGFMVVVGRRIIPFILHATAHTGSRELFRLAVLAIALGVAAGAAYLFGVSLALGAFFAGMILSESELSHRAAQETLPLRDAFGVLFFVSVGMLFDPSIIFSDPLAVIATLAIIMVGKSLIGFILLVTFRRPVPVALTISAALAQIGEFSFILVALGVGLGLIPEQARSLVLTGAIVSIVLNPLSFWFVERLRTRMEARAPKRSEGALGPVVPDSADEVVDSESDRGVLEEIMHPTHLNDHIVLVGYGRVGGVVAGELLEEGAPFVLVEDAEGRVHAAREAGIEVIVGNAATTETLRLANVMGARCVIIAIPNAFEAGQAVEQCRKLSSAVRIIARAHAEEEISYLDKLGANKVIMGEREIGLGMIDWLKGQGRTPDAKMAPLASGENLLQRARDAQPARVEPELAPLAPATSLLRPDGTLATSLRSRDNLVPGLRRPLEPSLGVEPILPPAGGRGPTLDREPVLFVPETAPEPETPSALPAVIAVPAPVSDETSSLTEAEARTEVEPEAPAILLPPAAALAMLAGGSAGIVAQPEAANAASAVAGTAFAGGEAPAGDAVPSAELAIATGADDSAPPARETRDDSVAQAAVTIVDDVGPLVPVQPVDAATVELAPAPVEIAPTSESVPVEVSVDSSDAQEALAPGASYPLEELPPATSESAPADTVVGTVQPYSPSPGFRVVPASEIVILPPEPRPAEGAEEPAPVFRSEFWAEPAEAGDEPELFATTTASIPPLTDVHEAAAARAAVEDGSWLEALERDLFGDNGAIGPRAGEDADAAEAAVESRPVPRPDHPPAIPGEAGGKADEER